MADRCNTKDYWDVKWSSPKRRVETYAMRIAVGEILGRKSVSVLDIGCGNGRLLGSINDGHRRLLGIDISSVAIARMKKEYGIDGLVMDIDDIAQLQEHFECVVANHILEHIDKDQEFLEHCKQLLTENGFMFVAVPDNMSSPEETEEHLHMYNRNSLENLMVLVFGNATMKKVGHHLIAISNYENS